MKLSEELQLELHLLGGIMRMLADRSEPPTDQVDEVIDRLTSLLNALNNHHEPANNSHMA